MILSKKEMLQIVKKQLATDLNCSPEDFEKNGFIFCEAKENPGRRLFPRGDKHFEMLTMGGAVIVSSVPEILLYVKEQLDGKSRDDAFYMPFVQSFCICFLPDNPQALLLSEGYEFKLLFRSEIIKLYDKCNKTDFPYALSYDISHQRPDMVATAAYKNDELIGIAGVSKDSEMLWQIGINVLTGHRNHAIASVLTNLLTIEVLKQGKIPYYATAPGNIASQRTAINAGYKPAWTCAYRGIFNGEITLPVC